LSRPRRFDSSTCHHGTRPAWTRRPPAKRLPVTRFGVRVPGVPPEPQEDRLPAGQRTRNLVRLPRFALSRRRTPRNGGHGASPASRCPRRSRNQQQTRSGACTRHTRSASRWSRQKNTHRRAGPVRAAATNSATRAVVRPVLLERLMSMAQAYRRTAPCRPMEPATARAGRVEVEVPPAIWGPWPARAPARPSPHAPTLPLGCVFALLTPSLPVLRGESARPAHYICTTRVHEVS
jgi:hypothetical protein